ncbi:unnamed protein product, partial [Mesorhabditis spiculigera]
MPRDDRDAAPPVFRPGKILGKRWKVVKKIGEGGCGAVYRVMDTQTKIEAALKVESNNVPGGSVLKIELTVSSQVRTGINILYGLKQLHDIGFVHRDLKPANLAIGPPNTWPAHFVHVLDFGLSREYAQMVEPGKYGLRRPRSKCLFSDKKEVAEVKRSTADKMLLYNCPVQLLEYAEHLRELNYYTRPNYRKLYETLADVMNDGGFKYDWERVAVRPSRSFDAFRGSSEDLQTAHTAPSHEKIGSRENVAAEGKSTMVEPADKPSEFSPGPNEPLPLAKYGDPDNPFPVEDFETNPLQL